MGAEGDAPGVGVPGPPGGRARVASDGAGSRVASEAAADRPPRPITPVAIAAAELAAARRELADAGAAAATQARLERAAALLDGLEPYLEACTTPASPELRALAERTAAADWGDGPALEPEMLSGHVEGRLLAFLVRATRARRVLEVGMFTGYSALAMAEALPDDGEVVACEVDARAAAIAREAFATTPAGARITVELGPAAETLARLAAEGSAFDLVFVDADKTGYLGYVRTLLDTSLLAPEGIVCVDNTLLQGQAYGVGPAAANGAAITAFNAAMAADPRVEQVLLPVRDGVTLLRRA